MEGVIAYLVVATVLALAGISALVAGRRSTTIYAPDVGLLYRRGGFERILDPGFHRWWDFGKTTRLVTLSRLAAPVNLGEASVLSKDHFAYRVALAPTVTIVDPQTYHESMSEQGSLLRQFAATHPILQISVQSAVVAAAGSLTLDEAIADPERLRAEVQARIANVIPGAKIEDVLLTGLTLPPETRKMFTEVERARREGLAVLERARGEHAALRVLSNAARLVTDNPALASLRLLQAIEASKGPKTFVVGAPELASAPGSSQFTA